MAKLSAALDNALASDCAHSVEDVLEAKRAKDHTDLIDVIGNRVLVATRGTCAVCKASEQTLKNFVEARLRELVWPELVVEEVVQ